MDFIPGCNNPTVICATLVLNPCFWCPLCFFLPYLRLNWPFKASAHCLDGLALLCIITSRSLSSSLTYNTLPPISYDNSWFLFPMVITEHFSRLNSIFQSCHHLNILLRSSRSIFSSSLS